MLEDTRPTPLAEPSEDQVDRVAAMIDALLVDARSGDAVTHTSRYASDTFLGLDSNEPYGIGVADLLAVTPLDVNSGAAAVRALLHGGRAARDASALQAARTAAEART